MKRLKEEVVDTYLPMVAGNNDGACTSLFALLDEIHLVETFPPVGRLQLLSKFIITDSAGVNDGALGEDVLELHRKMLNTLKIS